MPYDKTTFVSGGAPGISAAELNKIGGGIATAQSTAEAAQTSADNSIPLSQKGVASGVATLGTNTKIPMAQIPTGSGNGLDSDTVDGQHASDLLPAIMQPSNVVLAQSLAEVSQTTSSPITLKQFFVSRAGKYRFVFDFHSASTSYTASAYIQCAGETIAPTANSTTNVYATYTVDTTIVVPANSIIDIKVNGSGGISYIKNCYLKGSTGGPAPVDTALI